jgi:hypothetical protein
VLNFEAGRAMNRWAAATAEVARRRRKLARAVGRLLHLGAARALARWADWLADARRRRAVMTPPRGSDPKNLFLG